jgi:hypothetical protein
VQSRRRQRRLSVPVPAVDVRVFCEKTFDDPAIAANCSFAPFVPRFPIRSCFVDQPFQGVRDL